MGISLKLASVWFFCAVYLKKKKRKKKVSQATKKLPKAELRMPSGGLGVRSSWCLSQAGECVFAPDSDGETMGKASSIVLGFHGRKTGSEPAPLLHLRSSWLGPRAPLSAATGAPWVEKHLVGTLSEFRVLWGNPLPALGVASPFGGGWAAAVLLTALGVMGYREFTAWRRAHRALGSFV